MPFIWNNKEYKLVPDNSNWDKLEFVVARKLHVQYKPEQKLSIDFIKNAFDIYGPLEKVEIFHENFNNTKFAHVSYKENRVAYFALLDIKQQKDNNIVSIRPADAHLQPDNPVDSSTSPFYNLPDDCFLAIFDYCDFHALAMLSTVCKKLSELLRTRVFSKIPKFISTANDEPEVESGLLTVSRLIQCINPPHFHLRMFRNLHNSIDWPEMSVDMKSTKSEISTEQDFFVSYWCSPLEIIAKRIKSIHLHRSVYDGALVASDLYAHTISFPVATELVISGFARSCKIPNLLGAVNLLPKLEIISIRNGTINWEHVVEYCENAEKLQDIKFENCSFDSDPDIHGLAKLIEDLGHHFPLCLTFVGIYKAYNYNRYADKIMEESKYSSIRQALKDETVSKYIHIRVGCEPFSD